MNQYTPGWRPSQVRRIAQGRQQMMEDQDQDFRGRTFDYAER
jgi:hypothetical protein